MKKNIVIVFAALGVAAVAYGTLSAPSSAQAPAGETMAQKVVRLEKEVSDLRKEVARLKRYANVITIPAANPQIGGGAPQPGKPFDFNGQTYYYVPLSENVGGAGAAVVTPTLKVSPLSPAPNITLPRRQTVASPHRRPKDANPARSPTRSSPICFPVAGG